MAEAVSDLDRVAVAPACYANPAADGTPVVLAAAYQPPRTGGMMSLSRRQVRRAISSQPRNCRSGVMQILTSSSRRPPQEIERPSGVRPGLALTKASLTSSGVTVRVEDRSRYWDGIFTAARAVRMVSK